MNTKSARSGLRYNAGLPILETKATHPSCASKRFHIGWQMQPTSGAGREATSRANVYEINQWLWHFGRGKLRLGGLSVAETEVRRIAVAKDGAKRAVATRARRRCKALKAAGAPGGLE